MSKTIELNRVVCKQGAINFEREKIEDKSRRYLKDIYTTCIDAPCRWVFLIFAMHYFISWFLFGGIWFMQALGHGDIEYYNKLRHADKPIESFTSKSSFTPCAREIYGFMSAYLFSIETQQSIG